MLRSCIGKPLNPWTADSPPFALVTVADAGIDDRRGRFREIFCEVLESRGRDWQDYRPCEEALTRVADEPEGSGEPVQMGVSHRRLLALIVPGVDCSVGDGGAIDRLRPATRRSWLAHNSLPDDIAYYSLLTYPEPDRISSVLGTTYRKLESPLRPLE